MSLLDPILNPVLDLFRGRTITVPPLDGAFKPDRRLDEADEAARLTAPDSLARDTAGRVLVATGLELRVLDGEGRGIPLAAFEAPVTALCAHPAGGAVVGLEDGSLLRVAPDGTTTPVEIANQDHPGLACPTALACRPDGALMVAQGSAGRRPSDWARDLMEHGATGSVRLVTPDGRATLLADGLAWPNGLAAESDGSVVVAEAWRHRLLRLSPGHRPETVLDTLPGYPARLSPARDGGWWLALFAPRNRLVEFVLTEGSYRRAMLAEVPQPYWIAPALHSRTAFLEPLQCGAVRTMGVAKAWAPSRSYGLIARLDARFQPIASLHSRADGRRHGVTDALDLGTHLLVACKGGDAVLRVDSP